MSDIDLIVERLEMRGHRMTGSRRRVLDAVLAKPPHFTIDDVVGDRGDLRGDSGSRPERTKRVNCRHRITS